MDDQTLNGKLPAIIAKRAGRDNLRHRLVGFGRSDISAAALTEMGIQAVHAIADHTTGNPAADPALSSSAVGRTGPNHPTSPTRPHSSR